MSAGECIVQSLFFMNDVHQADLFSRCHIEICISWWIVPVYVGEMAIFGTDCLPFTHRHHASHSQCDHFASENFLREKLRSPASSLISSINHRYHLLDETHAQSLQKKDYD